MKRALFGVLLAASVGLAHAASLGLPQAASLGLPQAASLGLPQAASFELTDTAGVTHTPASLHGKWVLINAWATWCAPCVAEMPELEALAKAHPDLVVLGLAVDGKNPRRALQFAERLHVSYPIVPGTDAALRQFTLRAYPTSILYDRSGKQALLKEGRITRAEVEAAMHARPAD